MNTNPDALLPCLCLDLAGSKTMKNAERRFGHCPLCHGTGACRRGVAEEFGRLFYWFESLEESAQEAIREAVGP